MNTTALVTVVPNPRNVDCNTPGSTTNIFLDIINANGGEDVTYDLLVMKIRLPYETKIYRASYYFTDASDSFIQFLYGPGTGGTYRVQYVNFLNLANYVVECKMNFVAVLSTAEYNAAVGAGGNLTTGSQVSVWNKFYAIRNTTTGAISYFKRTANHGVSALITDFTSCEEADVVEGDGSLSLSFATFCEAEKAINCEIQKMNNAIIRNPMEFLFCKSDECKCGDVKDQIKGMVLLGYFYNYAQQHINNRVMFSPLETVGLSPIDGASQILDRMLKLSCCKGCSTC